MVDTYLTTSFKDREQVKALGARWDGVHKRWFVPTGRDLSPFARWLPVQSGAADPDLPATDLATRKGMPLSQLLAGIAQAVAQAYRTGVWTTVEVLKADARNGHVYLELAERDAGGTSIAQARAMIWADTARQIVPPFERATGMVLGGGIKLLVRAKPGMHALYGMSLVIDAIDPEYTLGDLEARKREIRARLQREGLFEANRKLPPPWDYTAVLVVAPQGAAGLGDFQAEAQRLDRFGVCTFAYAYSRFQGERAAAEVRLALLHAMKEWEASGQEAFDAVAIIRGGGAVNDLAWLNDYDLARCICELDVPVLTGIGHERDHTVLDEVAHQRFDTPSKVIAGIEQLIGRRAAEARASFESIVRRAESMAQAVRRAIEQADGAVRGSAQRQLADARQQVAEMMGSVRVGSMQSIRHAADGTREMLFELRHLAQDQLSTAKQEVPSLLAEIRAGARQANRQGRADSIAQVQAVQERASLHARQARGEIERSLAEVSDGARRVLAEGATRSEAMMREIAGQGPEKSLGRGFAIVRSEHGATLTSATETPAGSAIEIEFRDGRVAARTDDGKEEQAR